MVTSRIPGPTVRDTASLQEAAARWHGRLNGGGSDAIPPQARGNATQADLEAFTQWLAESPAHGEIYAAVDRAWRLAREQAEHPQILALRQEAALRLTRRSAHRRPPWPRALVAGIVLLALGSLGVSAWQSYDAEAPVRSIAAAPVRLYEQLRGIDHYRTAIGERLNVVLDDGSLVTLNTRTEMRVAFAAGERKVELLRGQALFEVAKDTVRPFVVETRDRRFVAVGTAFDVRVDPARVQVTMLEGVVRVEPVNLVTDRGKSAGATRHAPFSADARQPDAPLRQPSQRSGPSPDPNGGLVLTAGQQLVIAPAEAVDGIRSVNPDRISSWRNGQVVVENTALADAVAELNRYTRIPIVLVDPGLADLRISGAFITGRNEIFVEAVAAYFPIRVHRTPEAVFLASRQ